MQLTDEVQIVRNPWAHHSFHIRESLGMATKKPTEEEVRSYQAKMSSIGELLHGAKFTWYVEGGHILPLRCGKSYVRQHGDVDMGVYIHELHDVVTHFRERGFEFFFRNYRISQMEQMPWNVYERADINTMMRRQRKRLFLAKVDHEGSMNSEGFDLREIDVHLHNLVGDIVYTAKQQFGLPIKWFDRCQTAIADNGRMVHAGSLEVFYFFKIKGTQPRHVADKMRIDEENLLTPDEMEGIRLLRKTYR